MKFVKSSHTLTKEEIDVSKVRFILETNTYTEEDGTEITIKVILLEAKDE
jgi:hypothetical protein